MAERHPAYWKVKAAVLTMQLADDRARAAVQASAIARAETHRVMVDAGLDPKQNHDLNDADETITPMTHG